MMDMNSFDKEDLFLYFLKYTLYLQFSCYR